MVDFFDLSDKELLRTLLFLNECTQEDLAKELEFDRSNISRVIREKQHLPPKRREKAEELLKKVQQERRGRTKQKGE